MEISKNLVLKKGDQIFILFSSVLRDNKLFNNPNKFIPSRWSNKNLDKSIVFGIGNQKCISVNYTPIIYKSIVIKFLSNYNGVNKKINISKDLYLINPFKLKFYTK